MKTFLSRKKRIIHILLLILFFSNFSLSFAYWASNIQGSEVISTPMVEVGEWDFEDVALVTNQFRTDYATVLALTPSTVDITDKTHVEAALAAYGLLSEAVKAELVPEYNLLMSLLNEIIALENSVFLDFEAYPYDQGLTGTLDIDGRTWFANDVFISNDPTYDVWIDTRSLALRSTSYFESDDLFINGIDKITVYHGALNIGNGTSYQFKVEYELSTNLGTWLTLQDGGSDLIVDVISSDPLSFTEIPVNITDAINIRFTPIISTTTDYINLDNIRIYEHVVGSVLEAQTFRTVYSGVLALTTLTVDILDKEVVQEALTAFDLLSLDAQTELAVEKALLDDLLLEIEWQEDIIDATSAVLTAESSLLQMDYDDALILVNALPSGLEKTDLLNRLSIVQDKINAMMLFETTHQYALSLTVGTVTTADKADVESALQDYVLLSSDVKAKLTTEKALLDSLLIEINNQIPTSTLVADFLAEHQTALSLTVGTVLPTDRNIVELALAAYDVLTVDAQNLLLSEKALLDNLLYQIDVVEATLAVEIAETSLLQLNHDQAFALVNALPSGTEQTDLLDRLAEVQDDIDSILDFETTYNDVLNLTIETVLVSDKPGVEAALASYGLLSERAKTKLTSEETLLLNLLAEIITFENSIYLDFENSVYDSLYTGNVSIDGRTWFGNVIAISNAPAYDVWIDERSLALKSGSYFESEDFFINGIDKITLYHGALNYNNGSSFAFKIEYELASNPGTWITVQEGGTDLIIDVISGDPLTFEEIDINVTSSINIRFTPVISNTTDYINLDNIRIYEYVVSSELEVTTFRTVYAGVLALNVASVDVSDKEAVEQALAAYDLLSVDAKADLTAEKSLLDNLLLEIELQEDILEATVAVELAETTYLQVDHNQALALVNALPSSIEKTDLLNRLTNVQSVINEVSLFETTYQSVLSLTVGTVTVTDKTDVEDAIANYLTLSMSAQNILTTDKALLDSLLIEINNQIPTATLVSEFLAEHQVALSLTIGTVSISDRLIVELALVDYDLLTNDAKAQLTSEKALLDSLILEIDLLEATEAVVLAETTYLQTDHDQALLLVNNLDAGSDQTDLLNRLVAVQNQININQAQTVDGLISALPLPGSIALSDEADIIAARSAYQALTTIQKGLVTNLNVLVAAESELANVIIATALVIQAESSNVQADVDAAWVVVNQLTAGFVTTDLENRLNAVQDNIDVTQASQLIVNYFAQNSVVVSRLNSNTIKEDAFLIEANNLVSSLGVNITVLNNVRVDRNNSTFTISITKNNASVTIDVDVNFIR
ncbi:hypothetical protein BK011_09065 [Tenericutes bacterium MZ-XQ]|nr:hypothetical protein BK011_09065 [Tenericutes bacterium MZ-XQ]